MLVGYSRVSTQDQNLDLQKDALEKAGCQSQFTDVVSGANDCRTPSPANTGGGWRSETEPKQPPCSVHSSPNS